MKKFLTSDEDVQCQECGERYRQVSWKHLRFVHGLTTLQYRTKHQLFAGELLCRGLRQLRQYQCTQLWKTKRLTVVVTPPKNAASNLTNIRSQMRRINRKVGALIWKGVNTSQEMSRRQKKHWASITKTQRQHQCLHLLRTGKSPWNKGRTGLYTTSAKTKEKLSAAMKGKPKSPATREKIKMALLGKPKSFTHRMALCRAQRLRWENKVR